MWAFALTIVLSPRSFHKRGFVFEQFIITINGIIDRKPATNISRIATGSLVRANIVGFMIVAWSVRVTVEFNTQILPVINDGLASG